MDMVTSYPELFSMENTKKAMDQILKNQQELILRDLRETSSEPRNMTYTVENIAENLDISRTAAYEFVKNAPFPVHKIGASIRISRYAFDKWLNGTE